MLIRQHLHDDVQQLALQRNRFPQLSDTDFRFFLQQIEGRQRTAHKLPTMATFTDWWYPVRLSCEQCSSEATASYKASLLRQALLNEERESDCTLFDLTAGYGVDTYFMSAHVQEAHYVERNAELCAIAQHNFALHLGHQSLRLLGQRIYLFHGTHQPPVTTHVGFTSIFTHGGYMHYRHGVAILHHPTLQRVATTTSLRHGIGRDVHHGNRE